MGIGHWLGGLFDPNGQQAADDAGDDITSALSPNSPYWKAGQLTEDGDIIQGAAGLQNANIGVNTSAVDADTAAMQNLGGVFGNIAANGGQLTQAALHQAQADLANTGTKNLKVAGREASATVLGQDQAERNWAAGGQTASNSSVLATALQKQLWNAAVSHANFEAALAGKGIDNQAVNLQGALSLSTTEAANAARNSQASTARAESGIDFSNAMAALKAIGGAASASSGAITDMMGADASSLTGNAGTTASTGYTAAPTHSYTDGYAQPSPALGTSFNQAKISLPTQSKYVNPVTGDTVDPNLPTTTSSWGDWLTNGSSLVS